MSFVVVRAQKHFTLINCLKRRIQNDRNIVKTQLWKITKFSHHFPIDNKQTVDAKKKKKSKWCGCYGYPQWSLLIIFLSQMNFQCIYAIPWAHLHLDLLDRTNLRNSAQIIFIISVEKLNNVQHLKTLLAICWKLSAFQSVKEINDCEIEPNVIKFSNNNKYEIN